MQLKRKLDNKNSLIKTKYYPIPYAGKKTFKRVVLGIGGNIGDVIRRFEHLFWVFNRSSFLKIVETSPILKNPPFGYEEQDYFYNALIVIETKLTPNSLLKYILSIENKFGRKRLFKDSPRTLDIDIIFYENIKMNTKKLTLPHYGYKTRNSVLIPLSYLKSYN